MTELFANQPTTTVAAGQSTSSTTWTVGSSISFPTAATGVSQFHVADAATASSSELITVTNMTGTGGNTWTVARAAEGTVAQTHAAGFTIVQVVTAGWLNDVPTIPVTVPEGGSGDTVHTSYALLAGGTTSTSPVQSLAAGTTGQVLTSGGSSALPAWQAGSVSTAGFLADLTGVVNVGLATAPTTGQILTATSGTTATWQTAPTGFTNPMTTSGDTIYENAVPAAARLAGNTTATKNFLTSTGSGSTANTPAWGTIAAGDVPVLNQNTTGTAATATVANALADLSGSVNVSLATAPSTGQVLTATSGTTATWQAGTTSSTANYLADLSGSVNVSLATAPSTGQVLKATSSTTATWQTVSSGGNSLTRALWTVPSPGATYTAATNELTAVSTSSGSGTVILPTTPAAVSGTQNAVKQVILGGGNLVTIQTQSGDTLSVTGGGTTSTLTLAGQAALLQYDGTSIWTIIADDLPASQIVILGGDLGNTSAVPLVQSTHLTVSTNTAATGTVNVNATSTRVFNFTQSGAATYTFTSSGLTASTAYGFEMYLNPGTFATTWPGSVTWIPAGTAPTLVPSTENLLVFETINQGTTWYGSTVQDAPTLPLPVADGGTGVASLSGGAVILGGTSNLSPLTTVSGVGSSGQVLTSNGTVSSPSWQAGGSLPLTTPGDTLYENASTVASRLAIGSAGQLLGVSGGLPVWENAPGPSGLTAVSLGLGMLTMQPLAASAGSGGLAVPPQDIAFQMVTAAQTQTVTTLGCFVTTAGVTTGAGLNAMGLYSSTGSSLATTGDMTAAYQTVNTYAEGTLGASYVITQGVNYYLGVIANFTGTQLKIAGFAAVNAGLEVINGNYTSCVLAGQSSWPSSFTPSTTTTTLNLRLMYAR